MHGSFLFRVAAHAAGAVLALMLSACERPPVDTVQRGYAGTGMLQVYNPRAVAAQAAINAVPPTPDPARVRAGAPKAGAVYQNVKVLGDLSLAEFGRTMNVISQWVAPTESCAYCHVEGNFADDSKYTKVVARRMLQMTQTLNSEWKSHVGATGVTCYTCHRGQPLPAERWFTPTPQANGADFIGDRAGQNAPARNVALASLPADPFTAYLQKVDTSADIRVNGDTPLPNGNRHSIKQAEHTYGLMMHMSSALGVNCTYCHNTRSFANWAESTPQRVTAWHGIRMVRAINTNFLESLTTTFPAIPLGRLGPNRDVAKANCTTCHRGAYKPLYGAAMAPNYPALLAPGGLAAVVEAAAAPASAAAN